MFHTCLLQCPQNPSIQRVRTYPKMAILVIQQSVFVLTAVLAWSAGNKLNLRLSLPSEGTANVEASMMRKRICVTSEVSFPESKSFTYFLIWPVHKMERLLICFSYVPGPVIHWLNWEINGIHASTHNTDPFHCKFCL